jgi:hypothetical protein
MFNIPCVRCSKLFERPSHPLAHNSSICEECKNISPETIYDQQTYNYILNKKIMENKQ